MSRSVLALLAPVFHWVGLACLAVAALGVGALALPARAAPAPDILDLTGVAHVQDELALSGRGVTIVVVGSAAVTPDLAAVVTEVAPDADVLQAAPGDPIDAEADVVVFSRPAAADATVVAALAARGVSIVVPMGDAGRGAALLERVVAHALRVAATAGPDVATATLDVKAPEVLGGRFGVRPIAGLGLPLATGVKLAGAVRTWDACGGASAPTSTGDLLLVVDAGCDLGPLVAAAATSGATALLVASPPGEVELWQPEGASLTALPVLAVDGRLASRLATSIAAGTTVSVELRDGLAADTRLVDTVLFASTRGPTFDAGTAGAAGSAPSDPVLTMGPELAAPGQGTASAAAYVAGVVALVREAHPDWSAEVIAAQLVATSAPAWSASEPLVGGSPSAGGAGGARASLSLGGSGRVDAYQALVGHVRMRPAAPATSSEIDLGLVRASAITTLTRTLTVSNDGETAVTVDLATAFRDASDAQGGVLVTVDPSSLELAAGEEKPATVSFRIDPAALRAPTVIPTAGPVSSSDAANAWAADEVDGWVRATVGDVRLAVPFFLVPRATATSEASADTCLAPSAFALTLDPADGPGGRAELFTLLADGDPTVGVRVTTLPTPALEVAVALSAVPTPGRSAIAVLVDGDGDHIVDHVLLAAPEYLVTHAGLPALPSGRLVSAVLTPAAEGAVIMPWGRFDVVETRAVVGDPLGPTRVVSGSLSALGLAADAAPTLAVVTLDVASGALASATVATTAPTGTTPGATLASGLVADPRCGYGLVASGFDVRAATPVALASGPACDAAKNASGLLALDLQADAAHAAFAIVPPAEASYTCDATIGATADPDICAASPDFRAHVHGACVGAVTAGPAEARTFPLGQTPVEVVIQDPWGHRATCQTTVDVADRAAPEVTCGTIDLDSNTLPLNHTSTAHDTCGGPVTVAIVGARCLVEQDGQTFDRPSECQVALDGTSSMQVVDVGPVANLFEWSVSASDEAGNEAQETCYANVTRDEVGAIGGGGCAGAAPADAPADALLTAMMAALGVAFALRFTRRRDGVARGARRG